MSHTDISELMHVIFSTKERGNKTCGHRNAPLIFLGGIARRNSFKAIAIGGTGNHAHILLSLPTTIPLAKAVQLLKGGSSKWLNENIKPRFEGNKVTQFSA
jgi:putative transposase